MRLHHIDLLTLILFTLLLAAPFQASAQITNPEGELKPADSESIWAQTLEGRYFNEFWNYQFYMDNGMKVHMIYSAANFGNLKSPVSGLRMSIYYPDGELFQIAREYSIDRLVQDRENHRFQLHPERDVYFEGSLPDSHRVVVKTEKDGVSYDVKLNLSAIKPGYQWGDGFFTVRNEQIGIVTHIPYAEAHGHITVNDRREEVQGTAYMDHTFKNQNITRIMHSGYRFIRHVDAENWDLIYALRPSDNREQRTIGYYLSSRNGEVEHHGILQAVLGREERIRGTRVAGRVELRLDNGSAIFLSRKENQEKYPLLGELGWLARRAAKSFLGGEVVDFRGIATLEMEERSSVKGQYNFFVID